MQVANEFESMGSQIAENRQNKICMDDGHAMGGVDRIANQTVFSARAAATSSNSMVPKKGRLRAASGL